MCVGGYIYEVDEENRRWDKTYIEGEQEKRLCWLERIIQKIAESNENLDIHFVQVVRIHSVEKFIHCSNHGMTVVNIFEKSMDDELLYVNWYIEYTRYMSYL